MWLEVYINWFGGESHQLVGELVGDGWVCLSWSCAARVLCLIAISTTRGPPRRELVCGRGPWRRERHTIAV